MGYGCTKRNEERLAELKNSKIEVKPTEVKPTEVKEIKEVIKEAKKEDKK